MRKFLEIAKTSFAIIFVGGVLSGCDKTTGIEKYEQATQILESSDTKENVAKAKELLSKACTQDHAQACFSLTHKNPLFNQKEPPENNEQLLEKSCDLGIAKACYQRGFLFSDKANAIPFNEKGCALDHAASCHLAGHAQYNGVNGDYRTAFGFYDKGCKLGNFWSCEKVADLYYHAHGVEQNTEKYISYHTKKCLGNGSDDVISCTNLGTLYQQGGLEVGDNVIDVEQSKAIVYFERACETSDSYDAFSVDACQYVSKAYKEGVIVRKDLKKAKIFHERTIEK